MKRSEKQLVAILGVLFALVLVVRVVPLLFDYYRQGREDIALLQERVERYRTLIVETSQWQEREQLKTAEVTDLQNWVFAGTDANLVSSSVQRSLRQLVASTGVELRETGVARYSYVGDWLMVEQDMDFALDQEAILPFLQALQAARPRLQIAAFSINRNRRQYTGELTVVGFSRTEKQELVGIAGQNLGSESYFPQNSLSRQGRLWKYDSDPKFPLAQPSRLVGGGI
jgi:Type II secretion system (T2SS), protein M subtype b